MPRVPSWSVGDALRLSIGVGKSTVTREDFEHAQAIFVFGQNPATNHPRMLGDLRHAKLRGCKIVVFNPLLERGLQQFTDPIPGVNAPMRLRVATLEFSEKLGPQHVSIPRMLAAPQRCV